MSQSYASSVTTINPPILQIAAAQEKEKQVAVDVTVTEQEAEHPPVPKGWRKALLVSLLCGAQFFDIFTACSAIAALPTVCTPCLTLSVN